MNIVIMVRVNLAGKVPVQRWYLLLWAVRVIRNGRWENVPGWGWARQDEWLGSGTETPSYLGTATLLL